MDEVTGDCIKLHNEELRNLYSSPGIIRIIKSRRMRSAGHISRMGRRFLDFGGKDRKKETLGRQRCRWVDNIKII
jgi:hypothetical protein